MPNMDRRSYDLGASEAVQGDLGTIVNRLEGLINQRQGDVNNAMSDFQADGVSDLYQGKETQWNSAAEEVRTIIALIRTTLLKNDDTARMSMQRARAAVDGIG